MEYLGGIPKYGRRHGSPSSAAAMDRPVQPFSSKLGVKGSRHAILG